MKTKPCIGYAPVVDGKIEGQGFCYERLGALMYAGVFYNGKKSKIIKVEIRPVKIPRKKKSAKRIRQQNMKQSKKPRRVVWRTIRGKS